MATVALFLAGLIDCSSVAGPQSMSLATFSTHGCVGSKPRLIPLGTVQDTSRYITPRPSLVNISGFLAPLGVLPTKCDLTCHDLRTTEISRSLVWSSQMNFALLLLASALWDREACRMLFNTVSLDDSERGTPGGSTGKQVTDFRLALRARTRPISSCFQY